MLKSSYLYGNGEVWIRLDFRNGQTRTFALRQDMIVKFAAHGAERKLADEIVGVKDITDAALAIDKLIARLNDGKWSKRRGAVD